MNAMLANLILCKRCETETNTENTDAIAKILAERGINRRHGVIVTFPYCGDCRQTGEPKMPEAIDVSFIMETLLQ